MGAAEHWVLEAGGGEGGRGEEERPGEQGVGKDGDPRRERSE